MTLTKVREALVLAEEELSAWYGATGKDDKDTAKACDDVTNAILDLDTLLEAVPEGLDDQITLIDMELSGAIQKAPKDSLMDILEAAKLLHTNTLKTAR